MKAKRGQLAGRGGQVQQETFATSNASAFSINSMKGGNYSGHLSTCGASLDFSVEWSLVGMPAASQPDSTPQALRTAEGREESEEDT